MSLIARPPPLRSLVLLSAWHLDNCPACRFCACTVLFDKRAAGISVLLYVGMLHVCFTFLLITSTKLGALLDVNDSSRWCIPRV